MNPSSPISKESYRFDDPRDWFSTNIGNWEKLLAGFRGKPLRVLEIGSYEGRSAIWMIENILNGGDVFYAVDLWPTPPKEFPDFREKNFDYNIGVLSRLHPTISVVKHKGLSCDVLPKILATNGREYFDIIYIDGSHYAPDVLADLIFSFFLIKVSGIIICDDYLWRLGEHPARTAKIAIDAFTNCFCERIEIVPNYPLYQIFIRKVH